MEKIMALTQQNKFVQRRLILAEEHEKEKELYNKKMIELEALLEQKQALQLRIESLREAVGVRIRNLMADEVDIEAKKKLESIEEDFKVYEELESLMKTNEEFQEARF